MFDNLSSSSLILLSFWLVQTLMVPQPQKELTRHNPPALRKELSPWPASCAGCACYGVSVFFVLVAVAQVEQLQTVEQRHREEQQLAQHE